MRVDSQFFHVLTIIKYNFDQYVVVSWSWFLLSTILFTALPADRHTLAPGILGFLIMCVSECCKCHFRDSNLKFHKVYATCTYGGLKDLKS
jgi:hypothetical protein